MCGIACLISSQLSNEHLTQAMSRMTAALAHRGPDADGFWIDPKVGLAFGHRRLAIIDLSDAGRQPMRSSSTRYVLIFNGEVYNFAQLRVQLSERGYTFRGSSDTEVMLAAFEEWGLVAALQRFIGMFAFALWDSEQRVLHIARDRVGVKPLYYGWTKAGFVVASELKAIEVAPGFESQVDHDLLASYVQYGFVPAPFSIYKNIYKLQPGCYLSFKLDEITKQRGDFSPDKLDPLTALKPIQYWSASEAVTRGRARKITNSDQAIFELDALLRDAIKLRLVSDVPIGAFLSGGIDSSLVVALMQQLSSQPVHTFSIGFDDPEYNEAPFAQAIAAHCGTQHTQLMLNAQDALEVVPQLGSLFDEPFADPSQIPTYLLSKLTRRHVTVALSGDGGDELFGGYARYDWAPLVSRLIGGTPSPLRKLTAFCIECISQNTWDRLLHSIGYAAGKSVARAGDKMHKLARVLRYSSKQPLHGQMASIWREAEKIVLASRPLEFGSFNQTTVIPGLSAIETLMYYDLITYLPDDVLAKVDRASMAASIEAREPLLDYRIVEFAWRLPLEFKIQGKCSKWILRKLLARYIPPKLFERPKMGFGVPLASWLRGPLKNWANDLLSAATLSRQGFFDAQVVQACLNSHLAGHTNLHYQLWNLLIFQAWLAARKKTSIE
ncbi:MAG: asparagine synthase (glutamine-hydrolyzing) [Oligoflexia bacterium]|nr:asparagine synthase (glutamine-hydrolyzing) [Oligoflexia bacterium]